MTTPPASSQRSVSNDPQQWDQRYREGNDGWELGLPAPPLEHFLRHHPSAPRPNGLVLVPGCGRGHEAALLAELGYTTLGLDFSAEAIKEARRRHGADRAELRWLQADLFDHRALQTAGLREGSLAGVVEHTCFCAIDPAQREAYRTTVASLLRPGGWLLGLFFCHSRPGGPPFGSDPQELARNWRQIGLRQQIWLPAEGSVIERDDEWLGLWHKPLSADGPQ
ncbi:MAG: methyltransferase domain-containing protein [Chitinophagaceae bacterium]|nr:methyltransferase domain-containing protein [Chitinophagaceae bacterium]